MTPYQILLALFGFLTFVVLMPPWIWFVTSHPSTSALQIEAQFLASLALPATVVLFIVSWVQPG